MAVLRPGEIHITKMQICDKNVYLKINWIQNSDNLFHIHLVDGEASWSGMFSKELARNFAEKDNIMETEEKYEKNVMTFFTAFDAEKFACKFSIDDEDCLTAKFSWMRKFTGKKIQHGQMILHRDPEPLSKDTLIDILLKKNDTLKYNIQNLSDSSKTTKAELEKFKNELEKYVTMKSSLETTLYGKFVQLLNTKKRRIQLLEETLLNFEEPHSNSTASDLDES